MNLLLRKLQERQSGRAENTCFILINHQMAAKTDQNKAVRPWTTIIVSDPHKEQECVSGIIVSITLNKHHSVKK